MKQEDFDKLVVLQLCNMAEHRQTLLGSVEVITEAARELVNSALNEQKEETQ